MATLFSARWRHEHRRVIRRAAGVTAALALVVGIGGVASVDASTDTAGQGTATVGSSDPLGILLPTGQRIRPIGHRILITDGRLLSSTISPNGRYLAALTWEDFTGYLTIIDLQRGAVIQQVGTGLGSDHVIGDGDVAADGPLYSADGTSLWFPQGADLVHFHVDADGTVAPDPVVIPTVQASTNLNTTTSTTDDLPSGMALSRSGARLYVALNGTNQLGVVDTATNRIVRYIAVGNAPRQVVLVGDHAFVSDEGGRHAKLGEYTNESDGTAIVANKVTGATSTGDVSEVDLSTDRVIRAIPVGLEPSAEHLVGRTLMVANSNDDSFSLIDTTTGAVVQTVNVNPLPGSTVGSYPNSITMPNPHQILVSIGRDNALAVYDYDGPRSPVRYVGLLPTDFYPVDVAEDTATGKVVVTNDKGIGARGPDSTIDKGPGTAPAASSVTGHNTYDDTGSVTTFAMPSMASLASYTHQVFVDNGWEHLLASQPIRNSRARPVPIPAQLGQPSTIKHVFLIVRENRTYDQDLGDLGRGNGDPALAQFGRTITPNGHALADQYVDFDNFYDEGTLSADGHNWLVQADANDYLEREFGAFYRSYPAQGGDALAYQRDGFLWNAAEAAGRSVEDFGEYNNFLDQESPTPSWSAYYQDSQILEGKASGPLPVPESSVDTYADIPSLNAIDDHLYPAFDLGIPDQYRTDIWQQSFERSERTGKLANLNLIWMPDDHTAGIGTGDPQPTAEVADNGLAVGRMISDISHSRFWGSSVVFVLEDDTQNGVDHVDGHRGPLLVASPWAARGKVDDTFYTQLNVVKTIEQILGIAPMNQEDRAAEPMFDAFNDHPDFAPYDVRANQVPLTEGLTTTTPTASAMSLEPATPAALGVPVAERSVYEQWVAWSKQGHFNGRMPIADWANPAQLNRLDWYSAHDWRVAYPGDAHILAPDQVPGRQLPADYLGDD